MLSGTNGQAARPPQPHRRSRRPRADLPPGLAGPDRPVRRAPSYAVRCSGPRSACDGPEHEAVCDATAVAFGALKPAWLTWSTLSCSLTTQAWKVILDARMTCGLSCKAVDEHNRARRGERSVGLLRLPTPRAPLTCPPLTWRASGPF